MFYIYKIDDYLIKITYDDNFIIGVSFVEYYEEGVRTVVSDEAHRQLKQYFAGKRQKFSVPIKMSGTDFQVQVWQALLEIPYGYTVSYQDVAVKINRINACRAVGNANNKNKIAIIIPCHRVIGKNSKIRGYAFGKKLQQKLLQLENDKLI